MEIVHHENFVRSFMRRSLTLMSVGFAKVLIEDIGRVLVSSIGPEGFQKLLGTNARGNYSPATNALSP
jgi:hypothetical protein